MSHARVERALIGLGPADHQWAHAILCWFHRTPSQPSQQSSFIDQYSVVYTIFIFFVVAFLFFFVQNTLFVMKFCNSVCNVDSLSKILIMQIIEPIIKVHCIKIQTWNFKCESNIWLYSQKHHHVCLYTVHIYREKDLNIN